MEKLTWEAGLGGKGFISEAEQGLALPSLSTLTLLADRLGIDLVDLVNVPDRGTRNELLEVTRTLTDPDLRRLLREARALQRDHDRSIVMAAERQAKYRKRDPS